MTGVAAGRSPPRRVLLMLAALLLIPGCSNGGDSSDSPAGGVQVPDVPASIRLSSPAFEDGGSIPDTYTCEGPDRSPPLRIGKVPGQAAVLVLIMEDLDAPDGGFDHWTVWNLPPGVDRLPPGLATRRELGRFGGAHQGVNDFSRVGYGGPCPPPGETHRYRFRVYALNRALELPPDTRRAELIEAMEGRAIARGDLTGRFRRASAP